MVVIFGYLGVVAARAAGRAVDRKLDGGLDAFLDVLGRKFRRNPAADLTRDPRPEAREAIARDIARATRDDGRFGEELGAVIGHLDRLGGRQVINNIAGPYLHHQGRGNIQYIEHAHRTYHPHDVSHAPAFVKVVIAIGMAGLLLGVGVVVVDFMDVPGGFRAVRDPTELPNFGLGLGISLGSFGLLFVAQVIAMLSKHD